MIDNAVFDGLIVAELFNDRGELLSRCEVPNLITNVGDQMYAERGAGIASPPAIPTGMRIGTGTTAVAKSGAGAAIVTKVTAGNLAFDATYPTSALSGSSRVITYKCTYGAGVGTTASPIAEAVIVNDAIATDTATAAANTVARALLTGLGSKGATDTLTLTWTHTLSGS
jgi:hypothetical protein